ncbi:multiheme c-type cytochrome [Chitinophaga japonensis]|uniref:Cytochrome c554/c'-like protein n=1 Tax=Chitinophaga japonensis TaxID=104662 RepID=A0A562SSZ8_CHIJA|nr:multiheme c-type cytochrome [Chitinophaga japonensis]TWI84228.1 cytochrome c554/c'-like protein [Chitinophaga japonensis]
MNKRLYFVSCLIALCMLTLSYCIGKRPPAQDLRGPAFAGSAACINCHRQLYDAYVQTAHYHTSGPATPATVKGSFSSPDNVFRYRNGVQVVMEARDSGLFQAAYQDGVLQEAHRFDITVGSGRKAQTYLYWQDGRYFQLPLSYFVPAHSWANSPGFPPTQPKFDRVIPSTCFGCHSSMVAVSGTKMAGTRLSETFDRNRLVYGIDCERCHGPAAEHVAFHTAHPQESQARHMTRIGALNNRQQLDLCAVCHSGLKTPKKSIFGFRPGHAYTDYFYPDIAGPGKPGELDVHGTQYQLFTASQCFQHSADMNCSSCHSPHTAESNKPALFSQRCMSCHNTASHRFCKLDTLPSSVLSANCIDCHMPALPSGNITLLTRGRESPTPDSIRTHLITVYREATRAMLVRLQKEKAAAKQ